jgi:hypothetical protein
MGMNKFIALIMALTAVWILLAIAYNDFKIFKKSNKILNYEKE